MKRALVSLLVAGMTISMLAGCGSSASSTSSSTDSGSTEAAAEASADGEKIHLEFFNQKEEITDILDELFAGYMEEHPDVEIEVVSPSDATTVLTTRVSNGDVPDIYTHWPKEESYALVEAGAAMDLSDTGVLDNIDPSALEVWNTWMERKDYTGEYCATISYNFSGLWYNKDILAEAGYDEFPQTWDELLEALDKIQEMGVTPIEIAGLDAGDTVQQLYIVMASAMSDDAYSAFLSDSISGNVDPDSDVYGEELLNLAEKIATLRSYAQDDVLGADGETAAADFATGKTAMFLNGSWKYPTIVAANADINCEMAPIPGTTAADTKMAAYPGDFGIWVSANLEGAKKDAALELVKWMASADFAQAYAEKDGSPSCIEGVDYIAEPLAYAYDNYVSQGQYVLNTDCNWTAAQNDTVGSAVQQLYSDSDAAAFVQNLADSLNNNLD